MTLLRCKDLEKSFGGVVAVEGCDFTVDENSITGLIGPNGAGKTTVFNLITGLVRPDKGSIVFEGTELTDLEPHEIFSHGISRTFQMLRVFPDLTVLENIMLAHPGTDEGMFDRLLNGKRVRDEEVSRRERAEDYLWLVGIEGKKDMKAGDLSYGQQKLLDIARCLATEASLLLLDEPVAGVNPTLRKKIRKLLGRLKKRGKTVLLVEHDMSFVMDICDQVVVMDHGDEIAVGTPKQVRSNKKVIEAYLGK